jgi:hypothetical protein
MVDGRFDLVDETTVLGTLKIIDPNLPTQLRVVIAVPDGSASPAGPELDGALYAAVDQINAMNEALVLADESQRSLSFQRLLYVLPLPHDASGDTGSFNDLRSESPPALPAESHQDPYTVSFVFIREAGLSRIVEAGADPFELEPLERLQLTGVAVQVEAPDA